MTDLTKLALAGVLSASVSAVAVTAVADTTPMGGTDEMTTEAPAATGDAMLNAEFYEDLIEALKDVSEGGEDEISAIEDADTAMVVRVSEIRTNAPDHQDALDEALEAQEDKRDEFRSAIEDNESLKEMLEFRGLNADDVVAVKYGDAEVTLVVDQLG